MEIILIISLKLNYFDFIKFEEILVFKEEG